MGISKSLLLSLAALQSICSPVHGSPVTPDNKPPQSEGCKEVSFKVSGSALNLAIPAAVANNLSLAGGYITGGNFTFTNVSGSEILAGWYCPPLVKNANNNKLQIFEASITNNRDAWLGQGGSVLGFPAYQPGNYSWVLYSRALGYATLALDHLGDGLSSKPDPVALAQAPYEVALTHDLVKQIKAGKTGQLPRSYQYLIYVGNSWGSVMGSNLAQAYPNDFQDYILTGFSNSVLPSLPGVSLAMPEPAAIADPARFGTLPAGYLTTASQVGRTNSFFGDPKVTFYDPEVANLFFQRKDVVSFGQFVSTYVLLYPAPAYKGRVLVLTGEHDQAFCGPGSPVIGPANCGPLLKETKNIFPNAKYNWYSVANSGHALILHLSHAETLRVAHEFLAGASFQHSAPGY